MSSGNLSQEEITSLLQSMNLDDQVPAGPGGARPGQEQERALEERLAGAVDAGAAALTVLLNLPLSLSAPEARLMTAGEYVPGLGQNMVMVKVEFVQGVGGALFWLLSEAGATAVADVLLGGDVPGDGFLGPRQSAYGEAISQLFGAWATRFSEVLGTGVSFAPPEVTVGPEVLSSLGNDFPAEAEIAVVSTNLVLEGKLQEQAVIIMEKGLVDSLAPPAAATAEAAAAPALLEAERPALAAKVAIPSAVQEAMDGLAPPGIARGRSPAAPGSSVTVQAANFGDLGKGALPPEAQNIDLLMDVTLQLTVELGRARRKIRDVLAMGPGSVVELDRLAGEAVDVLVNGKLIAKGEVVVIDENFGVRITDIVTPAERVRGL